MSRNVTALGRMLPEAQGGRGGTATGVPFLVLDLGRGCDPHQARCRRCRWRSRWRMTAVQARAEHARHQAAAHGQGRRPDRRARLGLGAWGRPR